jgi:DNA-nicking Smr family endonuclease
MRPPRGLSADEAALWRKVADTVVPLHPVKPKQPLEVSDLGPALAAPPTPRKVKGRVPPPLAPQKPVAPAPAPASGLDGSWDRKLSRGAISPDITIDLHGMTLDAAYARLVGGIGQALAMGARVVLLIAGKHRPHDFHDQRGERRGAIRAKLLDWLAASPHASSIAAVRPAQQRHGGAGAVYIVLRKGR